MTTNEEARAIRVAAPDHQVEAPSDRETLIREVAANLLDRIGAQRLSADLVRGVVGEWERLAAAPDHQVEAPSVVDGETALETFDRLNMTVNVTVAAIIAHYRSLVAARPVVDDAARQALAAIAREMHPLAFGRRGVIHADNPAEVEEILDFVQERTARIRHILTEAGFAAALGGDQ